MSATLSERLRALPFYLLPHHAISWLMFKLARIRFVPLKNILIFIYSRLHKVNMQEAVLENKYAYDSLNAFFTRALKPECRPMDPSLTGWLCPVDGSVSQVGTINHDRIFQAKGIDYSLIELLGGDKALAKPFINGFFATLYLSPKDYHRIHMPVTGKLQHMVYVPGRLYSVAPYTVNSIPRLFTRNERCVCYFDTEHGPMALILVGAINVSAMETVWHGPVTSDNRRIRRIDYSNEIIVQRGEEMGRFNMGSTVIVLGTDAIEHAPDIVPGTEVKLGQRLARCLSDGHRAKSLGSE